MSDDLLQTKLHVPRLRPFLVPRPHLIYALIDEALAFLLDHLPPQLHLVIVTREDPNLPLAPALATGR